MRDLGHRECHQKVPTLMEEMIFADGWGMRAMVVRRERACSSSTSLFLIRSVSNMMQFSDPHAGNASNSGCLSKQLINISINLCSYITWLSWVKLYLTGHFTGYQNILGYHFYYSSSQSSKFHISQIRSVTHTQKKSVQQSIMIFFVVILYHYRDTKYQYHADIK